VGLAAVWEPPRAESGAIVRSERAAWVERWGASLGQLASAIGESGAVTVRYSAGSHAPATDDIGGYRDALAAALEQARSADVARRMTRVGPHRDDLVLAIDGKALPVFGSAGQHRTVAIALRLIEAITIRSACGAAPVLLLDDPFAELDDRRARAVLRLVSAEEATSPGQVVLAVPRESDIPQELIGLERWRIVGGMLTRAERAAHA
jgi:DNA replication and repair protein RecF